MRAKPLADHQIVPQGQTQDHWLLVGASPDGVGLDLGRAWVRRVQSTARVIAVDGGLKECLRLGLKPDLWVGDGDSLFSKRLTASQRDQARSASGLSADQWVSLPVHKNQSDLGYSLQEARRRFGVPHSVVGLGFTGGRADHHWGGVLEWVQFVRKKRCEQAWIHGPQESYGVLSAECDPLSFVAILGQTVSLFAMTPQVRGLKLSGLHYSWHPGDVLRPGTHGLSNVVTAKRRGARGPSRTRVAISMEKGKVLVVLPHATPEAACRFVRENGISGPIRF